jgi:predicted metal-dependent enzyme (double-stranded beta helix superfamily)
MSTIQTSGLTTIELRALARELLEDRARWEPLVQATPERRHYELLREDDDVTVWLISWMDGHDTGYHDHDISAGAVAVAQGSVREERLRVGGAPQSRVHEEGAVLAFEPSDIHRIRHEDGEPAVTIHVYSPPLRRNGAYVFDPGGALLRRSQPATEELRPLPAYGKYERRSDHRIVMNT